jgi:hypothetical protein
MLQRYPRRGASGAGCGGAAGVAVARSAGAVGKKLLTGGAQVSAAERERKHHGRKA